MVKRKTKVLAKQGTVSIAEPPQPHIGQRAHTRKFKTLANQRIDEMYENEHISISKLATMNAPPAPALTRAHSSVINDIVKKNNNTKTATSVKKASAPRVRNAKTPKPKLLRGNDCLTPRTPPFKWTKEPFFESNEVLPFISVQIQNKLAIRAVIVNDLKKLESLINDIHKVSNYNTYRSVFQNENATTYATKANNWPALQLTCQFDKYRDQRIRPEQSLLQTQQTGQSNFYMVGRHTRAISMTRGAKEGINALLKETPRDCIRTDFITTAVKNNIPFKTITDGLAMNFMAYSDAYESIITAVRAGHRKLAGKLVETYGGGSFNLLHREVLVNDNEKLTTFKAISVKKKGRENRDVMPIHCACINPNTKYLEELIAAEPDFNPPDLDNWRSTHYAAACTSDKPLRILVAKNASVYDVDKQQNSPLHVAARVGRVEPLKYLIKELTTRDTSKSFLDTKNRQSYAPMHLAAINGHLDIIKELIASGANADIQTGAGKQKVTPLILACQQGHMEVVKFLVEKCRKDVLIDRPDKLKRTAFVHAIIGGQAHVANYLVGVGIDPNIPDSSGNSAAHYAAAYGWYFCVKLLISVGADMNAANDWKLTPLAVSYLKGHMGLADLLLEQPGVDINCRNDDGETLVSLTLVRIDSSTVSQIEFLIQKKKADPSITDSLGNTPLHKLATCEIESNDEKERVELIKMQKKVAEVLISGGCPVNAINDYGASALAMAVENSNLDLVEVLLNSGASFSSTQDPNERATNIFHHLALLSANHETDQLFKKLVTTTTTANIASFMTQYDADGYTPFLRACLVSYQPSVSSAEIASGLYDHRVNLLRCMLTNFGDVLADVTVGKLDRTATEEDEDEMEIDEEEEAEDEEDEKQSETQKDQKPVSDKKKTALHILATTAPPVQNQNGTAIQVVLDAMKINKSTKLLEAYDGNGLTALHVALVNSQCSHAKQLIDAGANINAKEQDTLKKTGVVKSIADRLNVLDFALKHNVTGVLEELLDRKVNLTAVSPHGRNCLHMAASAPNSGSSIKFLQMLLEKEPQMAGKLVNQPDKAGRTPLHVAVNGDSGTTDVTTEVVEKLLALGANPFLKDNDGCVAMHYAFKKIESPNETSEFDPVAITMLLVKSMKTFPAQVQDTLEDKVFNRSPLHYAAIRGSNISAITLQQYGARQIHTRDIDGNTPLALAVLNKHISITLTLLQAGSDILGKLIINPFHGGDHILEKFMKTNSWTWKPIRQPTPEKEISSIASFVIHNDWQGIIYIILDLIEKNKLNACSLIGAAIRQEKWNLAKTLIRIIQSKDGGVITESDDEPLFATLANSPAPNLEVAEALHGSNVKFLMSQRKTPKTFEHPLLAAAKKCNLTLLIYFIKTAAKPLKELVRIPTPDGHTMLTLVFWDPTMIGRIVGKKPNICDDLITDMFAACGGDVQKMFLTGSYSYPAPLDLAITYPSVSPLSVLKKTPILHHAVRYGCFDLIKWLLQTWPEIVCSTDENGDTALMVAVERNDIHMARLLLSAEYERPKEDVENEVRQRGKTSRGGLFGGRRLFQSAHIQDGSCDEDVDDDDDDGGMDADEDAEEEEHDDQHDDEGEEDEEGEQEEEEEGEGEGEEEEEEEAEEQAEEEEEEEDHQPKTKRPRYSKKKTKTSKKKSLQCPEIKPNKYGIECLHKLNKRCENVVHILADVLPYGSYQNIQLLQLFHEQKVNINAKDIDRQTPLDIASTLGQKTLVGELVKFLKLPPKPTRTVNMYESDELFARPHQDVHDVIDDEVMQQEAFAFQQKQMELQFPSKKGSVECVPHILSGYMDIGELVEDASQGIRYAVLLIKVDLSYGLYGYFTFYRLQLIKRKNSNLFILFTNWGRVGDDGQYQKTPFSTAEDGQKEFKSIFRQKTGNGWDNVKTFDEKPNKYRLVALEEKSQAESMSDVTVDLKSNQRCKLPVNIQEFMKTFCDVGALRRAGRRFMNKRMYLLEPLGAINREQIKKAKTKLDEIIKNLQDTEKERDANRKVGSKPNTDKLTRLIYERMQLSTEFYTLLPIGGKSGRQLPVIDDDNLADYRTYINMLLQLDVATKLIFYAAANKNTVNPYDTIYNALHSQIYQLKPDSEEVAMILRYIHNGSPKAKISGIYGYHNGSLESQFEAATTKMRNHKLLWHGTSVNNMLSILKRGLLVSPMLEPCHGAAYGSGIYTADVFAKSQDYCSSNLYGKKTMLLCEVALGVQKILQMDGEFSGSAKKTYDSTLVKSSRYPDPTFDVTLHSGVVVPLGKLTKDAKGGSHCYGVGYREYIVPRSEQVLIRYLVEFD